MKVREIGFSNEVFTGVAVVGSYKAPRDKLRARFEKISGLKTRTF